MVTSFTSSSGGLEEFGGDLKVAYSIGIKSEFNRINQWRFVEGQVRWSEGEISM